MFILSNVAKLYDGTSPMAQSVLEGVDVFVREGRIHEVRPHDPSLSVGPSHAQIDASSYTVTPGLFDCHGHVTILGLAESEVDQANSHEYMVYVEKALHTTLVDGGVTTMRDIGGATHRMKRLVDEGVLIGPRLKIAICMLSSTGGHADDRGPDRCHAALSRLLPEAEGRPSSIVDGPWECRKRVREIAACGADLVKLCTSPGVASPSDRLEHRDFSPEEIEAICDEAEARGLRVAAHAHSKTGIEMAIRYGVHDIQHISFMDERLAEMAHARGCVVTPTSWVIDELQRSKDLSPFVMEKTRQVADVHRQAVAYARSGGLPLLAGTDAVIRGMHGRNYMELAHLIRDGLDPLEAWYGATGLAAREIGQDDTGEIAPGKRADLLVCDADVVEDPARLAAGALVEVIKDGEGYRGGLPQVPQRSYAQSARDAQG